MKLALCLIVKPTDEEADYLGNCLDSVVIPNQKVFDDVFITITGYNDRVKEVAEIYGAKVSYFQWTNNFAEARNFNFSQVPKDFDYIVWCDADDLFRGLDKLRSTIEAHQDVDAFTMYYMYSFDEYRNPNVVHLKTQVVRNDGCVTWVGRLHEDFKENREVKRFAIEGIERLHMSKPQHFESAKQRNVEIAALEVAENSTDPRSYWNYGNALKAAGRNKEAIEVLQKFLEMSESDEEKYIIRMRIAEALWGLNKRKEAIDEARYAIGIRPQYPDAYHLLGSLYFESERYLEAKDSYLMGLTRKPPYYSILVYNPRDYDYVPMMNLAKTYFQLNLPNMAVPLLEGCVKIYPHDEHTKNLLKLMKKEEKKFNQVIKLINRLSKIDDKTKLKKEFDKIPKAFKAHPAVCNLRNVSFVKQESSGKDIVFFCGFTEEHWTPDSVKKKGIGGSEEAVIWLSSLLVKNGWNVTVYNNCGHEVKDFDGVTYMPFWMWNYRDRQDVTILWRSPKPAEYDINSKKIFVDLHDVIPKGEFTEKRMKKIDGIFVKSKFHRSLFDNIPDNKFIIVPNGLDPKVFDKTAERDKYLIINTSSPERCLDALLPLFEKVKERVPEAKLIWVYGWQVFDAVHQSNDRIMSWKNDVYKEAERIGGIELLDRISHEKVSELYLKANIYAYPTEFAEIDCISVNKAMAAGCLPIMTDFAALREKEFGIKIHSTKTKDTWSKDYQFTFGLEDEEARKQWINETVRNLESPISEEERSAMRKHTQEHFSWERIVNVWIKTFLSD